VCCTIEVHNYLSLAICICAVLNGALTRIVGTFMKPNRLACLVIGLVVAVDPCVRPMPLQPPQLDDKRQMCRMPVCRTQSLPELPVCPMPKDEPPSK
jgi:hypothetical protein